MDPSQAYIAFSIVILAVIAVLVLLARKDKKDKGLSPLAGLAFGFILAGILFGEDRFVGYGLIGTGVLLAVIDMIKRSKE